MMADVNYCILGELFNLLERVEVLDGVAFSNFDPDISADVEVIARDYLKPAIKEATVENQAAIGRSIAFYSQHGNAPFQLMKERCHELTLPNSVSWPTFFRRVGLVVFGDDFLENFRVSNVQECPDEKACEAILSRGMW